MTFVITEPCIGVKDAACLDVCPVDCIYEGETMFYINPEECIDCAACEPVCPVAAIFAEDNVPEEWKNFIPLNYDFDYNVLDIVSLANCVLAGNCNQLTYGCAGDMNGDGGWNVLDIVTLVNCVLVGNCDP